MFNLPLDYVVINILISIIACIGSILALRVASHKNVNVEYLEKLKMDLDKQIAIIQSFKKSSIFQQSKEVKNPYKVYCKKHGWVYPIILPDGSMLCPYLHRLYPPEELNENDEQVNLDLNKGDMVNLDLKKQIEDLKKRLNKLERTAMVDSQVIGFTTSKEEFEPS